MAKLASLAFPLLLCCCSKLHSPSDTRDINGVLLIEPDQGIGTAGYGWDEGGQPIVLIMHSDRVVHERDALAPRVQACFGTLYDATFVIRGKKEFRGTRLASAWLVNNRPCSCDNARG
jgi:hypothetical protein